MTKKPFRMIINFSIFLILSTLIFSGWKLVQRKSSENDVQNLIVERNNVYSKESTQEEAPFEPIKPLYEYKPNSNLDFLNINTDFTGWLAIEDTIIDYPVVRGHDNEYYLNRDIFKNSSDAGAIFMDYRNIGQFNDRHTIIYGHYMKNGTMFGSLHSFKDQNYYDTHQKITLNGLFGEKTYTIFSAYIVSAEEYTLQIDFKDVDYEAYVTTLHSYSMHEKDFTFNEGKALLTLATCSYEIDNGRIVIHAIED